MADDPHDEESFVIAEISIKYVVYPDGVDMVQVDAEDNGGGCPPLLTMLGMLEMAKDGVVKLASEPADDEDEG